MRRLALVLGLLVGAALAAACDIGDNRSMRSPATVPTDGASRVAAVLCSQAPRARGIGLHLEAARGALARLDEATLVAETGVAGRLGLAIQQELAGLGGASPGFEPTEDALVMGLLSVASWGLASGGLFESGLGPVPPSEREEWSAFFSRGLGAIDELGRRYESAGLGACWTAP